MDATYRIWRVHGRCPRHPGPHGRPSRSAQDLRPSAPLPHPTAKTNQRPVPQPSEGEPVVRRRGRRMDRRPGCDGAGLAGVMVAVGSRRPRPRGTRRRAPRSPGRGGVQPRRLLRHRVCQLHQRGRQLVQWTVTAATAGTATLAFRYANGTTADRPTDITVNGSLVARRVWPSRTGAWTTWATTDHHRRGERRHQHDPGDGHHGQRRTQLDFLDFEVAAAAPPTTRPRTPPSRRAWSSPTTPASPAPASSTTTTPPAATSSAR